MMGSSFSLSLSLPPSPQAQPCWWVPVQRKLDPSKQFYLITTATSRRLGLLLRSFFQNLPDPYRVPGPNDVWLKQAFQLNGIYPSQLENENFSSKYLSCFSLFNGRQPTKGFGTSGKRKSGKSRMPSYNGRIWTNILLGINVLVYAAQLASQGNLLSWGAKVNSLIDKGQFWRLITASFLHADIAHLMVNCYSLNSIGPTIENFSGPRRFVAVYVASAVAGSAASYRFCKAPSIGASGAIFGLVGSLAVFVIRHRDMTGGGKEELQHIAQVIFFNMMVGTLFKGIDNWAHLGGLVGGAAVSWLVGPAWKYEALSNDGRRRRIIVDKAPIRFITKRKNGT